MFVAVLRSYDLGKVQRSLEEEKVAEMLENVIQVPEQLLTEEEAAAAEEVKQKGRLEIRIFPWMLITLLCLLWRALEIREVAGEVLRETAASSTQIQPSSSWGVVALDAQSTDEGEVEVAVVVVLHCSRDDQRKKQNFRTEEHYRVEGDLLWIHGLEPLWSHFVFVHWFFRFQDKSIFLLSSFFVFSVSIFC